MFYFTFSIISCLLQFVVWLSRDFSWPSIIHSEIPHSKVRRTHGCPNSCPCPRNSAPRTTFEKRWYASKCFLYSPFLREKISLTSKMFYFLDPCILAFTIVIILTKYNPRSQMTFWEGSGQFWRSDVKMIKSRSI